MRAMLENTSIIGLSKSDWLNWMQLSTMQLLCSRLLCSVCLVDCSCSDLSLISESLSWISHPLIQGNPSYQGVNAGKSFTFVFTKLGQFCSAFSSSVIQLLKCWGCFTNSVTLPLSLWSISCLYTWDCISSLFCFFVPKQKIPIYIK